jgi:3-oxoacyl-[acyl-carrier protein] reductase
MKPFESTTVLVTGAGQGIGLGIAQLLCARGADVLVLERDASTGQQAVTSLASLDAGGAALSVGSVVDAAAVATAFDLAEERFGRPVQGLVNNAGGGVAVMPLHETSDDLWDLVVDVNLKGTFVCLREFARRLLPRSLAGSAVNLSSLHSTTITDGLGAYCAAKAGVSNLTKVAASEWGRHGIRVNAVAPGSVVTPKVEELQLLDGHLGEAVMSRTPLGRFGAPVDVAHACAFLLSDESSWITGVTLAVDGGQDLLGYPSYLDLTRASAQMP